MGSPEQALGLAERHCAPCEGEENKLGEDAIRKRLKEVPNWKKDGDTIVRTFSFRDYYETVSFVNAVAWVAHRENHHPDISFGYKQCEIALSTHAVGGLSENDFISAAKIDAMF